MLPGLLVYGCIYATSFIQQVFKNAFEFELTNSLSTQAEVCLPNKMSRSKNVTEILVLSQLLKIQKIIQFKQNIRKMYFHRKAAYKPYNLTVKRSYVTFS